MPRQARLDAPGVLHHVICRGIERCTIFSDDEDRDAFVARLSSLLAETQTYCFAWALIPNHFHLLLRTGSVPLGSLMRRLLTGYAVTFNRRHRRSGHLFQNRFKSIVCQEDRYLLELVRYIHLNPLRAGVVPSLESLAAYAYSGHRQLLGTFESGLVATDEVLGLFAKTRKTGQKRYAAFVAEGVEQGNRPELVGGGVIRSQAALLQKRGEIDYGMAGDERILGDGEFVAAVLGQADQPPTDRQRYRAAGIGLEEVADVVEKLLAIDRSEVFALGKQSQRVQARSLLCYWAVRELGLTATSVARVLDLTQPAVSQAVARGEKLVAARGWTLAKLMRL